MAYQPPPKMDGGAATSALAAMFEQKTAMAAPKGTDTLRRAVRTRGEIPEFTRGGGGAAKSTAAGGDDRSSTDNAAGAAGQAKALARIRQNTHVPAYANDCVTKLLELWSDDEDGAIDPVLARTSKQKAGV